MDYWALGCIKFDVNKFSQGVYMVLTLLLADCMGCWFLAGLPGRAGFCSFS